MTRCLPLLALLCGCSGGLTAGDAVDALVSAQAAGGSFGLVLEPIEISTQLSAIGDDPVVIRDEIEAFWSSSLPCASVGVDDGAVVIDHGAVSDACVVAGRAYGGQHRIRVESASAGIVELRHTFRNFTDDTLWVDGTSVISFDLDGFTRTLGVFWDFQSADGEIIPVSGSHTYTLEEPQRGIAGPMQLAGERSWSSGDGLYDLTMTDTRLRLVDPVPETGSWALDPPGPGELTMDFARINSDLLEVVVNGTRRQIVLDVTQAGQITVR